MSEVQAQQGIRVLILAANPQALETCRLDDEVRAIQHRIRSSEHRHCIRIESRWAVRVDDLQQALLEVAPDVVHFSGHGFREERLF
jgi:hypothetical protein